MSQDFQVIIVWISVVLLVIITFLPWHFQTCRMKCYLKTLHSCFCSLDKLKSIIHLQNLKTTKYTVHAVCHNSSDVRDAFAALGSSLADLMMRRFFAHLASIHTLNTAQCVPALWFFLLVLTGLQDSWPSTSAGRINREDDGRRETQTREVFTLKCNHLHDGDTQTQKVSSFLLTCHHFSCQTVCKCSKNSKISCAERQTTKLSDIKCVTSSTGGRRVEGSGSAARPPVSLR